MSEQHAQRDCAALRIVIVQWARKFWNYRGDRCFEIEQAALVEDHRHGCRGHDLGERREIEDARSGDFGRTRIVGETTEGFVGDEFTAKGDRERASWEG